MPSISWNFEYSDFAITEELSPSSQEIGEDNIFVAKLLEKGFIQKNYLTNNNGVSLDIFFSNFEVEISASHPVGIDLIDRESFHHPAFNFELKLENQNFIINENEENIITKLDYRMTDLSELKLKWENFNYNNAPPTYDATTHSIDIWGKAINSHFDNAILATTPLRSVTPTPWLPHWVLLMFN